MILDLKSAVVTIGTTVTATVLITYITNRLIPKSKKLELQQQFESELNKDAREDREYYRTLYLDIRKQMGDQEKSFNNKLSDLQITINTVVKNAKILEKLIVDNNIPLPADYNKLEAL